MDKKLKLDDGSDGDSENEIRPRQQEKPQRHSKTSSGKQTGSSSVPGAPPGAVAMVRKHHQHVVKRQKSQKIVLAPSSTDDPIYHIYGEFWKIWYCLVKKKFYV